MESDRRKEVFEKLYMDNQERLVSYAMRFVSDREVALDIVHDSFIKYWERYFIEDRIEAKKIIFIILRNSCLDHLKHQKISSADKVAVNYSSCEEFLYNFDYYESTEDYCLLHELNKQIEDVLGSLPLRCRQVFELSRFKGKKNREIASELGISVSAVEKHISRALKSFERVMANPALPVRNLIILMWLTQLGS